MRRPPCGDSRRPDRARRLAALAAALAAAAVLAAPAAAARDDDVAHSRERAALAEEQAHLGRKLERLHQTMRVLAGRLEAEGRPQAVELLRSGIALLDSRNETETGSTLTELMQRSTDEIDEGQLVGSLENQQRVVESLEKLLAVLMDRQNLENLEEEIAELREMQREVERLADEEAELREETAALRRESANGPQRELEAGLEEALREQRELLEAGESLGRRSGTLELERLERALEALLRNQEVDAEVLRAWRPRETEAVRRAAPLVAEADSAESSAARLGTAARDLEQAARRLEEAADGAANEAQRTELAQALERAAEREERYARVGTDPGAEAAAGALREAVEALQGDGTGARKEADALRARAEELDRAAAEERAEAELHRAEAAESLEELAEGDSAAGVLAEELRAALQRAQDAAARGSVDEPDPDAAEEAARATQGALRSLGRGLDDLERLGEALSASQAAQAEEAQRLERSLGTLEAGDSEPGQEARGALQEAARAMEEASAEARAARSDGAARSAAEAQEALERAREALSGAREAAGRSAQEEAARLSHTQAELAERAEALRALAPQGSMRPDAERRVEEALDVAREAMERASEELSSGRSASAAGSQREATEALRRADQEARAGVTPSSPDDQRRAGELAERQAEIRAEILWLATRAEERDEGSTPKALEQAAESASRSSSALERGALDEAQEAEADTERELREALDELQEEEQQYQNLRAEELLFRITEELQSLIETHREQMQRTAEVDARRAPDDPPSRIQRLRLRSISREEAALGERCGELADAIAQEGSVVFAEHLSRMKEDLELVARDLGEVGEYRTGERVQSLQRDVEESAEWLLEALREEQRRREREQQQQEGQQQQQDQQQDENRLVPDTAELKLLRRMEFDVQDAVDQLLLFGPELSELPPEEVDPFLLRDVQRIANRHERLTRLFSLFRGRLGLPDPDGEASPPDGETDGGSDDPRSEEESR